jgi:hypothetical protein
MVGKDVYYIVNITSRWKIEGKSIQSDAGAGGSKYMEEAIIRAEKIVYEVIRELI